MSLLGQVDWYFQVIVCAHETCGMASVAAPVAPAASRNLRRDVSHLRAVMLVMLLGRPQGGSMANRHGEPAAPSFSPCIDQARQPRNRPQENDTQSRIEPHRGVRAQPP